MKNQSQFPGTIPQVLLVLVCGLILVAPLVFVIESLKSKYPDIDPSNFSTALGMFGFIIIWLLFVLINRRRGHKIRHTFKIPHEYMLLLSAVLFVMTFQIGVNPYISASIKQLLGLSSQSQSNSVFMLLSIVLFAPILEEMIFRGVILDGFLKSKTKYKAILFSTLIFSLVHVYPTQLIGAFVLGLLLAFIYYKTKNLGFTIILHVVANATGMITGYFREQLMQPGDLYLFYGKKTVLVVTFLVVIFIVSILLLLIHGVNSLKSNSFESNN